MSDFIHFVLKTKPKFIFFIFRFFSQEYFMLKTKPPPVLTMSLIWFSPQSNWSKSNQSPKIQSRSNNQTSNKMMKPRISNKILETFSLSFAQFSYYFCRKFFQRFWKYFHLLNPLELISLSFGDLPDPINPFLSFCCRCIPPPTTMIHFTLSINLDYFPTFSKYFI